LNIPALITLHSDRTVTPFGDSFQLPTALVRLHYTEAIQTYADLSFLSEWDLQARRENGASAFSVRRWHLGHFTSHVYLSVLGQSTNPILQAKRAHYFC